MPFSKPFMKIQDNQNRDLNNARSRDQMASINYYFWASGNQYSLLGPANSSHGPDNRSVFAQAGKFSLHHYSQYSPRLDVTAIVNHFGEILAQVKNYNLRAILPIPLISIMRYTN